MRYPVQKQYFSRLCIQALALVIGLGFVAFAPVATAETSGLVDAQMGAIDDVPDTPEHGLRNGSFVFAPIPFSDPTIGAGLVLGAGYLFNTDPGSKPSVIGIAALRSDNGSQGYGVSVNLAFDNNRWLFKSLFAKADLRYDLYTPAGVLPIRQDGVLGRLSLAYGVTPQLSFGGMLRYLDTTITPNISGLPPIPPPFNQFLNVEIASVGVITDWDRRDDTIYPTKGSNLHVEAFRGISLDGLTKDYTKAYANYTHYFALGNAGVLAARGSVCSASQEAPFFDQCSLGSTDGFRGFSATQFLDLRSASVQVEYRHQFTKRLGVVGFTGLGMVGPRFSDLDIGGTHSATGVGLRYRVSKKFPLDFSVDLAHNDLGDDQLYIYVGQRF